MKMNLVTMLFLGATSAIHDVYVKQLIQEPKEEYDVDVMYREMGENSDEDQYNLDGPGKAYRANVQLKENITLFIKQKNT